MAHTVRRLTIHCSGPSPIDDTPDHGDSAGPWLWLARLDMHRPRLAHYATLLDSEERARADRFRFAHDRERFIIAHGLLRLLLGERLGLAPDEVVIRRGTYGKPFVDDPRLRFNLSDTKDAVLIALAQGHEVGADLETMHRTVEHTGVAEHYFTAQEVDAIATAADGKRRFLELWTRKEAVLKASGVGILDDLRSLRVDAPLNEVHIAHEAFIATAAPAYHVRTWHRGEEHVLSLAAPQPIGQVHFRSLD